MKNQQKIAPELLALINADIDDELSAEQKKLLDQELESSESARNLHQQLLRVNQALEEIPLREPSRSIAESVLEKIEQRNQTIPLAEAERQQHQADAQEGNWLMGLLTTHWRTGGAAIAVSALFVSGLYQIGPDAFKRTNLKLANSDAMLGTVLPKTKMTEEIFPNHMILRDDFKGALSLRAITRAITKGDVENIETQISRPELEMALDIRSLTASTISVQVSSGGYTFERLSRQTTQDLAKQDLESNLSATGNTIEVDNAASIEFPASENTLYSFRLSRPLRPQEVALHEQGITANDIIEVKILADKQLIFNNKLGLRKN